MDCSKTEDYLRELGRMCQSDGFFCSECLINRLDGTVEASCLENMAKFPAQCIDIVQKWSKEHPQKTYLMDFFEKNPKAKKTADGRPLMCIADVYGEEADVKDCEYRVDKCIDCWNRPMPEVE